MHAAIERNSWRLPPEEIVQVADPRSKKVQSGQELVYSGGGEGRNWRSVVFSLLVIAAVIAGILMAIHTLGWVDELLYWSGRRMVLQEYLQADLTPDRLPPAWISPAHFIFQADDGGLSVYHTTSDNVTQLVANHTIRQLNVKWFQASSDLKYVLLRHSVKQVFRHTFTAMYTIYDVENDHHIPVRLIEPGSSSKVDEKRRLEGAWWCGNTTRLVLVSNNDIYFRLSPIDPNDHRITFTGQPGVLYNGVPDWLYQEEILGGERRCMWCSDDGSLLMYTQFNDSLVRNFAYPWLGVNPPTKPPHTTFPTTYTVRYPTPGKPNPTVRLMLANLTNLTQPHIQLKPPAFFDKQEYYLTSAGWVNRENTKISAVWINRSQNVSVISFCIDPTWVCTETHSERAAENGWIDIQSHPVFSEDGGSFLVMAQVQEGETDVYTHIKHITLKQQRIAVISHGRYQVTNILAWDYVNHLVYYLGSHETRPGQRHMYVVKDPATDEPLRTQPECITCDLMKYLKHNASTYTNCSYFSAHIPPLKYNDLKDGVTRYILQCDGPGLPLAGVHNSYNHTLVRILFNIRGELGEKLRELALPKQRTFEVPLAHGYRAQVQLLLPPSWREELRDAAYPVLVHIDGRPGSESVSERYNIDWGTYMSSRFDVVYVKLDVGGSVGRGSRAINRRIGSNSQVQDYLLALKYLLENHKFFDRTRIAVWGRGYGGYITIRALSSQHSLFKCGIAISPIAEWLYYNSAFTEKVLGIPTDNFKLYVEADALQGTKHIDKMALYLVHGLADISVPYVHSAALAASLTDQGVLFRYQNYADQDHDLTGVLEHLYNSMEEFLSKCLNLECNE